MKKSYSKFIALGSLVALTLTYSCKKLLTQEPVGSLSASVLATKAGVDGLLIGAYSMLDGYSNNYGTAWETGIDDWVYGGIAADDAYKGSNTTDQPTAAPLENHSVDGSNEYLQEKWQVGYTSVQRANDAIREVPLASGITAAYGQEVIAEARFLRGVFNMELSKVFRNVPYVDETVTYSNGNFNVSNSGGPIWSKIEADFAFAMTILPKTQAQVGRANYYAAEALLAKAYMFDHKYSTALPLLNDLINNGVTAGGTPYAFGPFENNFNAATKNGPESVFAVQMSVNDGSGGNNGNPGEALNFPAAPVGTSCCGFDQPSVDLGDAYQVDANGLPLLDPVTGADIADNTPLATDHGYLLNSAGVYTLGGGSGPAFVPPTTALDPRIDWTLGRYGIPYLDWGLCGGEQWSRGDVTPYNPKKNLFYLSAQASTSDNFAGWAASQDVADNYNLVRLSDLYLWRAECEIEASDLTDAEADVNVIRNRMAKNQSYWVHAYLSNSNPAGGNSPTVLAANYKISPYPTGYFASKGQAWSRNAVYMETRLEFGMEGRRFFDLQRWDGLYGGPAGSGFMAGIENAHITNSIKILGSNPVLAGHTFTAGKNELFPIPLNQIDFENGALKQNPGY